MVISRVASERFWAKDRRKTEHYKKMSHEDFDAKLAALEPPPKFVTTPRLSQKVSFWLGARFKKWLFLLDMGIGKTKVILDLIRWRRRRGDLKKKVLVLVPGVAHVMGWLDETQIHQPKLTAVGIMQKGNTKRQAALNEPADLVIMTYAAFLRWVCVNKREKLEAQYERAKAGGLTKVERRKWKAKLKKTKGWCWSRSKLDAFAEQFDGVVADECTLLGGRDNLMRRAFYQVSRKMVIRHGLNGTLFGSNPESMWGQFYVMDDGETLGPSIGLLREGFFIAKEQYWSRFPKYVFDRSKAHQLHEVLQNRSIRYEESECNDLPKCSFIDRIVTASPETKAYHQKLVEELKEAKSARNFHLVDNAFYRLRAIAAGFLPVKDPEGERVDVIFKDNPLMDGLVELLNELPKKRKALIFCDYQVTGRLICERLKREGIKAHRLYSKTPNKTEVVHKFREDKSRAFVLSSAGAKGLNLQCANYVIFFEPPTSPDTYRQMFKRAHRTGQKRHVFVYRLAVAGSITQKVYQSLADGKNLYDEIVNGHQTL